MPKSAASYPDKATGAGFGSRAMSSQFLDPQLFSQVSPSMIQRTPLAWQYDEFQQIGRDYGTTAEVDIYDSRHGDFRDLAAESNQALDALQIQPGDVVIDFGAGTGTFAIEAARRGAKVLAVDISQAMIDYAQVKVAQASVANIEFHHAGFLTFDYPAESVDAIATTFAFHHLPDFWKGIALKRMQRLLKRGGQLYLHDVIIEDAIAVEKIDAFIAKQEKAGGDFLREDAEGHFRDEYSTYDWVMDGLLSRAGFSITSKQIEGGVIGTYLCTKN